MPNQNQCYILFNRPEFGVDEAFTALSERNLSVIRNDNALTVSWDDGPVLTVTLARGQATKNQAEILGRGTPHYTALKDCDARFEIRFTDLDEVLDEINTLIETQLTLQDATQGFLYTGWNGQLLSPEE